MELHLLFGHHNIDPTASSLKSSECYSKIWSKLFQQQHNNNCKMEEIQNNGFSRHLYLSNVENSAYKCTISLHGSLRIIGNVGGGEIPIYFLGMLLLLYFQSILCIYM